VTHLSFALAVTCSTSWGLCQYGPHDGAGSEDCAQNGSEA